MIVSEARDRIDLTSIPAISPDATPDQIADEIRKHL